MRVAVKPSRPSTDLALAGCRHALSEISSSSNKCWVYSMLKPAVAGCEMQVPREAHGESIENQYTTQDAETKSL